MSTPDPITRAGAQRDAQHELSKAIYRHNSDPLPVRVVRALGRLIDHLLNKLGGVGLAGSAGAIALVVVLVVIAALVFWRVGPPRRAVALGAVLSAGVAVSAAEHRARSERAAAAADWHTAVLERMRAIARELEERSIVEPRAGRTATELAREAGATLPGAATDLRAAADVFNDVAYGGVEASSAHLALLLAADQTIRRSGRSTVLAR